MFDQAFHAAQTCCTNKDFRLRGDIHRRLAAAFDFEGEHSAVHRHLPLGNFMSRMRAQSRIMHVLNLSMLHKKVCYFERVLGVRAHPPRQRAHAAQDEPAIERRGHCTAGVLDAANVLKKFVVVLCNDNSTGYVTMAAEAFCRGMKNQIGAEIKRPLQHWRPSVVANANCAGVMNNLGDRRNIDNLRSEEHTSELQSQSNLVCRLLLEKKKQE